MADDGRHGVGGVGAENPGRLHRRGPPPGWPLPPFAGSTDRGRGAPLPAWPSGARRRARLVQGLSRRHPIPLPPDARSRLGAVSKKRIRPPKQLRLPEVLSDEQVRALLGGVRNPIHKACLALMYACGLRISEAATLEIGAIDRANLQLRIMGAARTVATTGPGWPAGVLEDPPRSTL